MTIVDRGSQGRRHRRGAGPVAPGQYLVDDVPVDPWPEQRDWGG